MIFKQIALLRYYFPLRTHVVRKVAVLLEPLACSSAELGCGIPGGPSRGDRHNAELRLRLQSKPRGDDGQAEAAAEQHVASLSPHSRPGHPTALNPAPSSARPLCPLENLPVPSRPRRRRARCSTQPSPALETLRNVERESLCINFHSQQLLENRRRFPRRGPDRSH